MREASFNLWLEVLSLFPVPVRALERAAEGVRRIVVVEENGPGLYASRLKPIWNGIEVVRVNEVGRMIPPDAIREAVRA